MRVRWTDMGKVMAMITLLLYGAALTSQSGFLLLLIGIILACYTINYFVSRKIVGSIQVNCPVGVQVCEGEKLQQPWKLFNESDGPAGLISVESSAGMLFEVTRLKPGETLTVLPDLTFEIRGVYPYGDCLLQCAFPFGLLKTARKLSLGGEVVVHPRVYDVAAPIARGYDAMVGGKFKGRRKSTSGAHFAGVRPFHDGDPLRQIHWKSSAKGQGLMVKVFDEELSGRIGMLIDAGPIEDANVLHWLARAAGSLIFAAQDEGHHVELGDAQGDMVRMIPPFADGREILDYLARLTSRTSMAGLVNRFDQLSGKMSTRASICLLMTRWNPELEPLIHDWLNHKRALSVYLPMNSALPDLSGLKWFFYSESGIQSALEGKD